MAQKPLTDDQCRETLELLARHGDMAAAARAVDIPYPTFKSRVNTANARMARLAREGHAPGHFDNGTAPGYLMGKVTVQRNADGGVERTWERQSPDQARFQEDFLSFIEAACEPLKGLAPIVPPPSTSDADLLAVYPIGDHHHGMKADPDETGDAYDCKIATRRLTAAVDHLSATAPPCREALLLNLGDYFHANDSSNQTPASGNLMDVDTRFGQVFDTGAMALIRCVLRLLEKHETVHVWNMRGNHDPDAAQALAVAMAFYFHDEPRVKVDRGTSLYKFIRFGNNLIASHHGHGAKQADLPLLMAVDRKDDWAATEHRVWHVGHFHHKSMKEHPGCDVEVHRTLAGTDAWHAGKGYRSKRDMQVIIYHRELGEVQRNRFDPTMLKVAA